MAMNELVIRNGTVVTASGIVEADIWIEDGKIKRVAKELLRVYRDTDQPLEEWDASGMYILPGFLALPDKSYAKIRSLEEYLHAVRSLAANGYTCMTDVLHVDPWKNPINGGIRLPFISTMSSTIRWWWRSPPAKWRMDWFGSFAWKDTGRSG